MPIRFVTAASLFDGHDVSINIMRRILQANGAEVIHLGHNRSALEVAEAAIQEDAHAIAISSYQGGHNEYFKYVRSLLNERNAPEVRIFGGGGGVITPKEIKELEVAGITRIYSPADGMELGLEGIVKDMLDRAQHSVFEKFDYKKLKGRKKLSNLEIAKTISFIEEKSEFPFQISSGTTPVLGVTGTGGAGKSSLIDELILRFNNNLPDFKIALISVDPTKKKTKGALLGDRIRLGCTENMNVYVRSLATRDSQNELSPQISNVIKFLKSLDFNLIIVETSGIGQASDEITKIADKSLYVMTPEFGAQTQLEKIEMLDYANFVAINKFDKIRAEDALRDVRKQFRRNHKIFQNMTDQDDDKLPIFGTMASRFNDQGLNSLFYEITSSFAFKSKEIDELKGEKFTLSRPSIIPVARSQYLREIAATVSRYREETKRLSKSLREYEALKTVQEITGEKNLEDQINSRVEAIGSQVFDEIDYFDDRIGKYESGVFSYKVRDKKFDIETKYTSLSGLKISKVALPVLNNLSDKIVFMREQNLPGFFPYAAGIYPFKRTDEDPKRMFAGEGGPSRTNKRFHYLSKNDSAKRLSTAFDSVTLYGEDPDSRLDIFGKIGEAGVSIATLDDMDALFKDFNLVSSSTSVSMTINGPAPIILAMFMNTAMKQNLKGNDFWDMQKRVQVMQSVRGTVQADILKEDQAQNTCIFSLEFALKMMGDVQGYFCKNKIRNYYSVSISGYHIAEAGANPITQLAFTLANGFTYVEYYLGRGLKIDDFAENLSYFFSNGLDPEYTVIGRVARKVWAIAMKFLYNANDKSQKFKYHVQTSGRSLHAQEIDFNDIRTTLQAFLALSDNCNSLHTNAYDEAITTPTEESVRRAMAIQMIINREFGLNKTDNPMQGSFIYDELCELVERSVLQEFERISDRGGVLGAMESMYQRSKIQEESLYYETLKDSGKFPIIGVNTYIAENVHEQMKTEINISRCSDTEKNDQIKRLNSFKQRNKEKSGEALQKLKNVIDSNGNIFEELLYTVNFCSLGQITKLLYESGGKYRRNM